jgi:hypothetical protein
MAKSEARAGRQEVLLAGSSAAHQHTSQQMPLGPPGAGDWCTITMLPQQLPAADRGEQSSNRHWLLFAVAALRCAALHCTPWQISALSNCSSATSHQLGPASGSFPVSPGSSCCLGFFCLSCERLRVQELRVTAAMLKLAALLAVVAICCASPGDATGACVRAPARVHACTRATRMCAHARCVSEQPPSARSPTHARAVRRTHAHQCYHHVGTTESLAAQRHQADQDAADVTG